MKRYLIFIPFIVYQTFLSQDYTNNNYLGKRFRVNVTGTFIPFSADNLYHKYYETTIGAQVSMSILKSLDIGVQTHSIFKYKKTIIL